MKQPTNTIDNNPDFTLGWKCGFPVLVQPLNSIPSIWSKAQSFASGITVTGGAFTVTGAYDTNLTPSGAGNVNLIPTGTGRVVINPATSGSINNMAIGTVTPASVKTNNLGMASTDHGLTASGLTTTTRRGRVRIPSGTSSFVVNMAGIVASDMIICERRNIDTTLTDWTAIAGAGLFTITGNAAATADTYFDYMIVTG